MDVAPTVLPNHIASTIPLYNKLTIAPTAIILLLVFSFSEFVDATIMAEIPKKVAKKSCVNVTFETYHFAKTISHAWYTIFEIINRVFSESSNGI